MLVTPERKPSTEKPKMKSLHYFSLTFSHHPVNDLPFTVKQLLQVVFLPLPKGLEYRASILESNGTMPQ